MLFLENLNSITTFYFLKLEKPKKKHLFWCSPVFRSTTMTTKKLKRIALLRLKEAEFLLENKNYSGAYYMVGYSINLFPK